MAKEWDPCPYSDDVLIGNWNEERFDVKHVSESVSLPSQYDHYFETTYKKAYHKPTEVPQALKYPERLEPTFFPGHQPQLDTTKLKADYNSYVTASMEAYGSNYYSLKKSKQKAAEAKSKSKKS